MVINSPLGSLLEEVAVVCNCYHILKYDAAVGGKLCTQRLITEVIIIIIIIYESCSAKSTNENDGALHSHKTLS